MSKITYQPDDQDRDCGCPHSSASYAPDAKVITLAIQAGGAHGAYAWGVIDRLLEDGRIRFEGLSGTSAGSINAVVFAYGDMQGGRGGSSKPGEITADVVMASAGRPLLFHAVQIGEDLFWDGGYMGNPSLHPFFHHTATRDVLVIHINPIDRDEVPTSSADILNRLNEITFNASLLKEMRAVAFVTKLIEEDWLKDEHKDKLKHVLVHSIRADGVLCDLSVASKFNTDWQFLLYLRDLGREIAEKWLDENFESIGQRSTVDLRAEFL